MKLEKNLEDTRPLKATEKITSDLNCLEEIQTLDVLLQHPLTLPIFFKIKIRVQMCYMIKNDIPTILTSQNYHLSSTGS